MATKTARRYWDNTGRHQKTYDRLYAALVPQSGNCETVEGEVLRAVSKLYYRFYNDGDWVDYQERDASVTQAHIFLTQQLPQLHDPLHTLRFPTSEKDYEKALEELTYQIICWVAAKKGQYTPNTDHLDYLNSR